MAEYIAVVCRMNSPTECFYCSTKSASKVLNSISEKHNITSVTVIRKYTHEILSRIKSAPLIDDFIQVSHPKYFEEDF